MVAIVGSYNVGLNYSTLAALGQAGQWGTPTRPQGGQQVYVNAYSGQITVQDQEVQMAGLGPDAGVLRTYNSMGIVGSDGGAPSAMDTWLVGASSKRLSYRSNLPFGPGGSGVLTRSDADGSVSTYQAWDSAQNPGGLHYPPGTYVVTGLWDGAAQDTLALDEATNTYVWTDGRTGLRERYARPEDGGRLLASIDRDGNTLTYNYGANGRVSSITTANGESTQFEYSGNNVTRITTSYVSNGQTITTRRTDYAYDSLNRLEEVRVDLTPADNSVADGNVYWTRYTYESNTMRMNRTWNSDGGSTQFTYVQTGPFYQVSSVTDGNGLTQFSYNINFADNSGVTTVTGPDGAVTVYEFGPRGRLDAVRAPTVNGVSARTQYLYETLPDGLTQVVSRIIDGQGRWVEMDYDARGNVIREEDSSGRVITRTFNTSNSSAFNELLTQTVHGDTPATTRYVYSSTGQLRFEISAEGRVTEHRYASGAGQTGNRTTTVQYGGLYAIGNLSQTQAPTLASMTSWTGSQNLSATQRTDMTYDFRGQLQSITTYARVASTGAGITDGTQATTNYVYDQTGQLLQTINGEGGLTQYQYDGLGRRTAIIDADNRTTVTNYQDGLSRISTTTANGLVTTTTYDGTGRVTSIVHSAGASQTLQSTAFTYDSHGRLRMSVDGTGARSFVIYDAAGRKVGEIDPTGSLVEYVVDQSGLATRRIAYANAVSASALATAAANPAGVTLASVRPSTNSYDQSSWNVYDAAGRLVATSSNDGVIVEYTYDSAGRLQRTHEYASRRSESAVDSFGNAPTLSQLRPGSSSQDRISLNYYDRDGLLIGQLDAEGYLTEFRYDAVGREIQRVAYANRESGQPSSFGALSRTSSAADAHTHKLYNARGQVSGEVDAEGYLTQFVYDDHGNVALRTRYSVRVNFTPGASLSSLVPGSDAKARTSQFEYNDLNQLVEETSPEGTVTRHTYDPDGRRIQSQVAHGTSEVRDLRTRYDALGRVTAELSAEGAKLLTGSQTSSQIDAIWAQHALKHTYDAASRRTSTTDALGQRTVFFYDADGHLTHTVNGLGEVEVREYNALNQLTSVRMMATRMSAGIQASLSGGIANSGILSFVSSGRNDTADRLTTYQYNDAGQIAQETDALGRSKVYGYSSFGDLTSTRVYPQPNDSILSLFEYDRRGFQSRTVEDSGGLNRTQVTRYDAFGRVIETVDPNGKIRNFEFDRLGRQLASVDPLNARRASTYDAFGRVLTETDAQLRTTTYTYNDAQRSMRMQTAEGVVVTTWRSAHGQVQSVVDGNGNSTEYHYNADGQLTQTLTPESQELQRFDRAGRLYEQEDGNGTVTRLEYDAANRVLRRIVDPDGLNLTTQYTYDAFGQQLTTTDPQGVTTTSTFDRAGQLKTRTVDSATGGLRLTTSYEYDALGRTVSVTDPTGLETRHVYDDLHRLATTRVDPTGLDLTTHYSYDLNGNVVGVTRADGELTRQVYDDNNLLRFVIDPMGLTTVHAYDGEGRLARTTQLAKAVNLTGLPSQPSLAAVESRLVYSAGEDAVEARVYDADGRLRFTVDGSLSVVERRYDGAGNVVEQIAYSRKATTLPAVGATNWSPPTSSGSDMRVRTVYDGLNRAIFSIDGTGAITETVYDSAGRVTERILHATAYTGSVQRTEAALRAAANSVADTATDLHEWFTYDAAGRLTWSVDAVGSVTRYVNDRNGRTVATTQYATAIMPGSDPSAVVSSADDRTTIQRYDAAGRRVLVSDATGAATTFTYDGVGRVTAVTRHATPLSATQRTQLANPNTAYQPLSSSHADNRTDRFVHDRAGRLRFEVDAGGSVTQHVVDDLGQRLATIRHATPAAGTPTLSSLTAQFPSLSGALDAADRQSLRVFDLSGRVIREVDPLGFVTRHTYDGLGRVTETTQFAQGLPADQRSGWASLAISPLTDPSADRKTSFTYDAAGRLLTTTDGLNHEESWTYNALGLRTSYTDKSGATWTYEYNAAGRQVREHSPSVAQVSVHTPASANGALLEADAVTQSIVTEFAYNALGNLTTKIEAVGRPEQRTTQFGYDAAGRQTSIVFAAPSDGQSSPGVLVRFNAFGEATANQDVRGNWSNLVYDKAGRVRYEIDAEGYVTSHVRNAFGDVVALTRFAQGTQLAGDGFHFESTIEPALAALTSEQDRTVLTEFDHLGRAVRVIEPTTHFYDAKTQRSGNASPETRYEFNAFGELVREARLRSKSESSESWRTTTHYLDARGEVVGTVDAGGYLTTYTRDAAGRITQTTEHAQALNSWNTGQLPTATAHEDDRTVQSIYDQMGRLIEERRSTVQNGLVRTLYTYDAVGNRTSTTDALNNVTYSYYDALGHVRAIAAPVQASTVNGAALRPLTEFRRDAFGNVLVQIDHHEGAVIADASGYALASGDLAPHEIADSPVPVTPSTDRTTFSRFDALGRQVQRTDANGASQFMEYDAAGNLTREWRIVTDSTGATQELATTYSYDRLGQRTSVGEAGAGGSIADGMTVQIMSSKNTVPVIPGDGSNDYFTPWTGKNLIQINWSGSLNPNATQVRFRVDYLTKAVDHDVLPEHSLQSTPASYTATFPGPGGGYVVIDNFGGSDSAGVGEITQVVIEQEINGAWVEARRATDFDGASLEGAAGGPIQHSAQYNAFGEVVARGLNGTLHEFNEYDNAGRLWRTNSGDGVTRAVLHDLNGFVTAEVRSATAGAISGLTNAAQVPASSLEVQRVDFERDALGRVTRHVMPDRVIAPHPESTPTAPVVVQPGLDPETMSTVSSTFHIREVVVGESESYHVVDTTNSITVDLTQFASLGNTPLEVYVEYEGWVYDPFTNEATLPSILSTSSQSTLVAASEGKAIIAWRHTNALTVGSDHIGGVSRVTRVVVRALPAMITYQENVLLDTSNDSEGQHRLVVPIPAHAQPQGEMQPDSRFSFRFRPAGSVTWTEPSLNNADEVSFWLTNDALVFDSHKLAAGLYDYEVSYLGSNGLPEILAAGGLSIEEIEGKTVASTGSYSSSLDEFSARAVLSQTFDRWGNLLSVTDPRSQYWVTNYRYDWNNQLIHEKRPTVSYDGNTIVDLGTSTTYDALGRRTSTTDGKGHAQHYEWDAAGNLTRQLNADGGVIEHKYNVFGDRLRTIDAMQNVIDFTYDNLGQLRQVIHPKVESFTATENEVTGVIVSSTGMQRLVDTYVYDQAGRRIATIRPDGETMEYSYDGRGNVTKTVQRTASGASQVISEAAYNRHNLKVAEVDGNRVSSTWEYDYFGRLMSRIDLGGARYTYFYNALGQLTNETNTRGRSVEMHYDQAGQLIKLTDFGTGLRSEYAYDLAGNRVSERTWGTGDGLTESLIQNNRNEYDAQGRLARSSGIGVSAAYEYDAVGNRIRQSGQYIQPRYAEDFGDSTPWGSFGIIRHYDHNNAYDAMNRMTLAFGFSSDDLPGQEQEHEEWINFSNEDGHRILYDLNGNRTGDAYYAEGESVFYSPKIQKRHHYDAMNRLVATTRDDQYVIDRRLYDKAGRTVQSGTGAGTAWGTYDGLVSMTEDDIDSMSLKFPDQFSASTEIKVYDDLGRLSRQFTLDGDGDISDNVTFSGYDGVGNLLRYSVASGRSDTPVQWFDQFYHRFNGYSQIEVRGDGEDHGTGQLSLGYDVNGNVNKIVDRKQPLNNRSFINDTSGIALQTIYAQTKDNGESDNVNIAPRVQRQWVVNGQAMANVGHGINDAAPKNRSGEPNFVPVLSLHPTFRPIDSRLASVSAYVVGAGDTLQSIAQAVYADDSQWWRIAQSNGLLSDADLRPGMTLTIPSAPPGSANAAGDFAPYDPLRMLGDTTPFLPVHDGGFFGALLQVIVAVVAIVVAYYTGNFMLNVLKDTALAGAIGATATTAVAYGIGGAAGSIASQGVAIATGLQKGFSWKSVGTAAIGSAVGGALGGSGNLLGTKAGSLPNFVVRAALGNALSQGIAVATGLQKQFSWTSVAASAVGAGVTHTIAGSLPASVSDSARAMIARVGGGVISSAIRGGGSRNIAYGIADAFGNALGDSIVANMSSPSAADNRSALNAANRASDPDYYGSGTASTGGLYLSRAQEDRLMSGRAVTDYGDAYADGDGLLASSTGGARRVGGRLLLDGDAPAAEPQLAGSGLRLPGEPRGLRLGTGAVDTMGQPLNGRSNYDAFSKLSDILGSSNGEQFSLGRLYEWATYTVPDAQQRAAESNARYGLAQDPSLARIDAMIASPIGAVFSLGTRALGGSQEAQDRMLTIGQAVEGLAISGAALKGRVADIFGAARPSFASESIYSLTSNNYLSGFTRSDKLGMGMRLEANQGLLDSYSLYGGRTATQLYVRAFDANGNLLPGSVRLDRVGLRPGGGFDLIDYKLSPNSPLTTNQTLHYPSLALYGGLVTGLRGDGIGLPRGTVLPPTPVNVKAGPTLRLDR